MNNQELQEIAHSGGRITFEFDPEHGTSMGISSSNPWAVTLHQVCISYDGDVLEFVPFGGIGSSIRPYPQPSLMAFMVSDREGMFGRCCPSCHSYFRTNFLSNRTYCPYCGHSNRGVEFITQNQLAFISSFCQAFVDAQTKGESSIIDLDALADQLPENRAGWVYKEERQQSKFKCSECSCVYDILGEYGICPACEESNFLEVIIKKLDRLDEQFRIAEETITDRHERGAEWERLSTCVSEFEALAKSVRARLLIIPLTPRRRTELVSLSFQSLIPASEKILNWFDIDILSGMTQDDKRFLHVMFHRRHVFVHNGGRVDSEYLERSGDTTVRLNQLLRLRSNEIRRLLDLTRQCTKNLLTGFRSLKPKAP